MSFLPLFGLPTNAMFMFFTKIYAKLFPEVDFYPSTNTKIAANDVFIFTKLETWPCAMVREELRRRVCIALTPTNTGKRH
jgi:hypothetical protein